MPDLIRHPEAFVFFWILAFARMTNSSKIDFQV
jgi:hypothetical protein